MWPGCLSAVLVVTAAFGCLCLVHETEVDKDRRFINSARSNSMHAPDGGSHCGPYYCTHGSCQYTNMNGVATNKCVCYQGWHGYHCDQTDHVTSYHAKDCTNHQCFHGHCERDMYNNEHCKCIDSWTGYQCNVNVAHTAQTTTTTAKPDTLTVYNYNQECHFHGYWTQSGCLCDDHWSGNRCEYHHVTSYHAKDCTNHQCFHGHCERDMYNNEHCKCNDSWTGYQCNVNVAHTVPTTTSKPDTMMGNNNHYDQACNYHGYWTHSGCHCHDNWSGDSCEYPPGSGPLDHCHNQCGEHGTCTRNQSHHGQDFWYCKCDRGWHGNHCTYQYIVTHTTHCHNTYCVNGVCTYYQDTMGHQWYYRCKCHHGWEGNHCDQEKPTSASSVSSTTPMPTKPEQTTTNSPLTVTPSAVLYRCDHIKTIVAVAYQTPVSNPNAVVCSQGQHTSHEAFVLTECDVPKTPATWTQGVNVMSSCASSNPVPDNTPIASFDHGLYSSVGSLSGIFLGCTSNGFKIAFQTCSQSPEITELRVGESFNRNPNNYFAIS